MAKHKSVTKKATPRKAVKKISVAPIRSGGLPSRMDAAVLQRLVAEAERGIPEEKLRGRGRPPIGEEASNTYSVRLPDELVALVDERSEMAGVTRGETVRRALIEYLTK